MQDPLNTSETVIVVRSVVPGGIAQVDGRLLPGDRIMYVNNTSLDTHTSLDCAVQALKGAPFGPVKIGISRPINFEDDSNNTTSGDKTNNIKANETKTDAKDDQEVFSSTRNKQLSVSVSQSMLSTKTSTTASASTSFCTTSATTERSERESASDTFAEGSNLSDWKTDYGVSLNLITRRSSFRDFFSSKKIFFLLFLIFVFLD